MIIQLVIVSIWLILCLYFLLYSLCNRNLKSLQFVTVAMVLQNVMSVFASNTLVNGADQIIILYKELNYWGIVLVAFLMNGKVRKRNFPILMFVLYLVVEIFRSDSGLYTSLICFRQIMTPFILFAYASSLRLDENDKVKYVNFLIDLGVYQAWFGLIERFVLGDKFWLSININKLFQAKGFDRWVLSSLPGNYYSYDFWHITGERIRRLVGIMTDPLLTGHYLALAVVLLLFVSKSRGKQRRYFELTIMTLAAVLTISKGAILIIGIAIIIKIWQKDRRLAIGMIAICGCLTFVIISKNIFRTVLIHMNGLTTILNGVSLFGNGLGSAGNLAGLSGNEVNSGENFMGMVIGQLGLFGALFFVCLLIYFAKVVLSIKENMMYRYAVFSYIIAIVVESFLSESSINYIGSGCAFILVGLFAYYKADTSHQICKG